MGRKRKNSNYHISFEEPEVKSLLSPTTKRVILVVVSAILALALLVGAVFAVVYFSYDGTRYYKDRDVSKRDTTIVEMSVLGYGKVKILLDATTAPKTVENFVSLVNEKFYDGLTFHRVIPNFMIQGGDPEATGSGGLDETIYGEFEANGYKNNDLLHKRGVISMARLGQHLDEFGDVDQGYNSASCQFFICNADADWLDGQYAAFGYVLEGMNVIDRITMFTSGNADEGGAIPEKAQQAVIEYIRVVEE